MKETNLPENAFRELKEGEQYEPLMKPGRTYREVTPWSIFWGLLMAVIFSAATAYLGLKVGQVFEAAIPITIIAVGLSGATHRKAPLGENVIIQSIGACSGMIVAGAIFTLPALYILQNKYPDLTVNFMQVFLASLLGGVLGILFLIPFRKYFVKDMHGKYPFPEATASTQVLLSGEKSGNQTMPLLVAGLIGGLYDFAGEIRTKNIAKGGTLFCLAQHLPNFLNNVEAMPEDTYDEIIDKYVEMNVAHPFMEGNGRSTRIWLDLILKKRMRMCVDWSRIDKHDYLVAMVASPLDSSKIRSLLKSALTDRIHDRELFMKGIDYSYYYEQED